MLHAREVFGAARDNINPRGIDAAVAEDVGKLGYILVRLIKCFGKQLAQIVREHLLVVYAGGSAQRLHLSPHVPAVKSPSAPGDKEHAG